MSSLSDSYKSAIKKKGGLKFKGQKKKDKKKRKKKLEEAAQTQPKVETRHGAFWLVNDLKFLKGNVLIETQSGGYLTAVDDGSLTTAVPRPVNNERDNFPDPQDIFTMVSVGDSRVAFKTAYNRYVTAVPDSGEVNARNEAMTTRELWEPVLHDAENGVISFRSADKKYLNGSLPGQMVHANSEQTSEPGVMFRVHTSIGIEESRPKNQDEYDIEGGSLKNMEENFVKKFQSFQNLCFREDSKISVTKENRKGLKKAKETGRLHEELLDRRAKIKGDKFCK